jgi:lipopolysaccharide export system permease protein
VTCIDRYILRIYVRTLSVCFTSFSGVFIVFHAFTNVDELNDHATRVGGMLPAMIDFYVPFLFMLFEMTGMIISLLALVFTFGLLRRSGELTAMLACGISHGRIVRPMLCAVAATMILAAINRECVLPNWQDRLGMDAQAVAGETENVLPVYDRVSGILLNGQKLRLQNGEIVSPAFKIHARLPEFGNQLNADLARWVAANDRHPAGYIVSGVSTPPDIDKIPSQRDGGATMLLTSLDTAWLNPRECFVASGVEAEYLRTGNSWTRMANTLELARRVRNPSVYCAADVRVTMHDRWLRPMLDFSLIVLSLGLVVGRNERNLFVVTGSAIGLVGAFFGMRTLFHAMGGSGYLIDPATAAWIPLVVLVPFAYVRYRIVQVS